MNAEALESEEQIMDGYRAAVAHAKGDQFASMLQVSHAGGWFTVRDLEGTESRYRKKEIVSLTRSLLKQPKFGAESRLDFATLVELPRDPLRPKPTPQKAASSERPAPARALAQESTKNQMPDFGSSAQTGQPAQTLNPVPSPNQSGQNKIAQFPLDAASPGLNRTLEKKAYFRNLWRILLVVATIIGLVVLVIVLKRH